VHSVANLCTSLLKRAFFTFGLFGLFWYIMRSA
jgi:hypothetical protein